MKWIKYIVGVFFLGMVVASIPTTFRDIQLTIDGWDNALSHVILGISFAILFGFIGFKLIKSARNENK